MQPSVQLGKQQVVFFIVGRVLFCHFPSIQLWVDRRGTDSYISNKFANLCNIKKVIKF